MKMDSTGDNNFKLIKSVTERERQIYFSYLQIIYRLSCMYIWHQSGRKTTLGGQKGLTVGSRQRGRNAQSTFYISIKSPSETQHHHNEHLLIKNIFKINVQKKTLNRMTKNLCLNNFREFLKRKEMTEQDLATGVAILQIPSGICCDHCTWETSVDPDTTQPP